MLQYYWTILFEYSTKHTVIDCVLFQAMRFPPKSYNKDLESAEVSRFSLIPRG